MHANADPWILLIFSEIVRVKWLLLTPEFRLFFWTGVRLRFHWRWWPYWQDLAWHEPVEEVQARIQALERVLGKPQAARHQVARTSGNPNLQKKRDKIFEWIFEGFNCLRIKKALVYTKQIDKQVKWILRITSLQVYEFASWEHILKS